MSQLGSVKTITATGADLAGAAQIPMNCAVTIINAGGADTGVKLPSDKRAGIVFYIANATADNKKVYPPAATSRINGAATGIDVAAGTGARFVSASNSALGAGDVQYYSC